MRSARQISVSCASLLVLMPVFGLAQVPEGFEVVQLTTQNGFARPRINNNSQVTWWKYFGGNVAHVFLFRDGEIQQITTSPTFAEHPDINDLGQITWLSIDIGGPDTVVIREPNGDVMELPPIQEGGVPFISNLGHVVWSEEVNDAYELAWYNGASVQQLTFDGQNNQSTQINDFDQIVWAYDLLDAPASSSIKLWSAGQTTQLSATGNPGGPSINNLGQVAWGGPEGIFLWDDGAITQITDDGAGPRLNDAGDIAFYRWNDELARVEFWLYRQGTFYHILNEAFLNNNPTDINNAGEVVWIASTPQYDYDVFMLRLVVCDGSSISDCNQNQVHDACDIDKGVSQDCNGNGVPDECLAAEADCNANAVPDACDLAGGTSLDADGNTIPDECQQVRVVPDQYPTIHAAIIAANPGDTVLVQDGTYSGPGNRNLGLRGKILTVRSANGPASCIIDCQGQGQALRLVDGETRLSEISGFTLRACGSANEWGGGMVISHSSPTISRCIITDNLADTGAGAYVSGYSAPLFRDCAFMNNSADDAGGLMLTTAVGLTSFLNCTFAFNSAVYDGGGLIVAGDAELVNCVVAHNEADDGAEIQLLGVDLQVSFSDIYGGQDAVLLDAPAANLMWGDGNIDSDPLLPSTTDYHLLPESACINAGDPAFVPASGQVDPDGDPRVLLGRVDMGADEALSFADCNGNRQEDWLDIEDGSSLDCNDNGSPDECDIAAATSDDCDGNAIPDDCEPDCNLNGLADACDLAGNDCNGNGVPDPCEVAGGLLLTADFGAGVPLAWTATGLWHVTSTCSVQNPACAQPPWVYFGLDASCDFDTGATVGGALTAPTVYLPPGTTSATLSYCSRYEGECGNSNQSSFDWAWVSANGMEIDDVSNDCNFGWELRTVNLSALAGQNVTLRWQFDSVDAISNEELGWLVDGIRVEISPSPYSTTDCDSNGAPDDCDPAADCNDNGQYDPCEVLAGAQDCDADLIPDECETLTDCNSNTEPDPCEIAAGTVTDCNGNGVPDGCDVAAGTSPDEDGDNIPDECPLFCSALLHCADLDLDGIRDDNCLWWTCQEGMCDGTDIVFADMGGSSASCLPDGVADANDRYKALNCFANTNFNGGVGFPCEANAPHVFNTDAAGQFGSCAGDGVCDANDAFAVLNAFSGNTTCSCPLNGSPMPDGHTPPEIVDTAAIGLELPRSRIRAGELVTVDVYLLGPVKDLRGYQLHLAVRGGLAGSLDLTDILVEQRKDQVFQGSRPWTAFNIETGQMLAGLDGPGQATRAGSYLATFVYRASADAAGRFTIEMLHDHADRAQRTFLFPTAAQGRIRVQGAFFTDLEVTAPTMFETPGITRSLSPDDSLE